ncbi:PepSY domain-containing protein [Rhizobacter sp. J219]|uniref:PepSY domain-containing protein n=1 Tax=Rhizobacter sp. J219 TaxID=2898430 RepID=UPI002150C64F|nr:PepSY domain-containing protein [Rhizobacter sp. J219]MCR5882876.1 PepSY domain-containing protein [Rhizobacter sp. J219]
MRIDLALLVLSLGVIAPPVWAGDDCEAPLSRWQTREAVRQMAAEKGWQVERLKIDDGCYEIRGTDAQGRRFKAKVDPETLKVLKMKQGDHERDRARERERDRDDAARATRPLQPSSAASGAAPRRQHE